MLTNTIVSIACAGQLITATNVNRTKEKLTFITQFLSLILNTCMKKIDDLTYQQQRQERKNDNTTQQWLALNGLNANTFVDLDLNLIQAQRIATNTLKFSGKHLSQSEANTLGIFIQAMRSDKTRSKLTQASVYKVLNIGKAANRKIYAVKKAAKKKRVILNMAR